MFSSMKVVVSSRLGIILVRNSLFIEVLVSEE